MPLEIVTSPSLPSPNSNRSSESPLPPAAVSQLGFAPPPFVCKILPASPGASAAHPLPSL
ncbi:MAG: hypothetical protein A3K18_14950 [Lentisphaerae bacterium RIFOXYA12_64_32]|nr:MAG: hypothetical protein A3K18_14950 [Lentisphaerae bacterium RIFOXYA12_64_32]